MKRIAMISEHASPLAALGGADSGGQNVYVGQLAAHLVRMGNAVDVFTRRDNAEVPTIVGWRGVRVVHVRAGAPVSRPKEQLLPHMHEFAEFVMRFCRRQRRPYDIVHANFFMSAQVAMTIKQRVGTPFVVTFHALGRVRKLHQKDADMFPAGRLDIEEQAVAQADRVIAECPQDMDDLVRLYGADPERLQIIPCGFDPSEFRRIPKHRARAALGLVSGEPIILQLGRLVPRKGVDDVIRGVARLRRRHGVRARLLIVGGESRAPDPQRTPEIGRLQSIAEAEGVADAVTFVGSRRRDELCQYYCAADVFVTTPWYEPFGITPVEAMACGTPVIGASVGGIKFTVRENETGFLVPPKDPDALAVRLAYLLSDRPCLERFGDAAIRRANARFTWERVSRDIAALYDRVCDAELVHDDADDVVSVVS